MPEKVKQKHLKYCKKNFEFASRIGGIFYYSTNYHHLLVTDLLPTVVYRVHRVYKGNSGKPDY